MKRVWIESTYQFKGKNLDHRKDGERAVGKAIWSPVLDKGGNDRYRNMRDVKVGDLIIHLTDNTYISGCSLVKSKKIEIVEGIENTNWDGPENYLWKLVNYKPFDKPILIKDHLKDENNLEVLEYIRQSSEVFYTQNLQLRQGAYLTPVSKELFTLINRIYMTDNYGHPMPNSNKSMYYDSKVNLLNLFEKDFEKISNQNIKIGGIDSYRKNHDNDIKYLLNEFDKFNFDFISGTIPLKPGDIDFVILFDDTLIIGEYKRGQSIKKDFQDWNGKKGKYLKFLHTEFPETKGKFNKVAFFFVAGRINEKKLNDIEVEFNKNGILSAESNSIKFEDKKITVLSHRIIHLTQLKHYFDVGEQIDYGYAKRDFLKNFNISPKNKKTLSIPAIKTIVSHKNEDPYSVYNFTCSAKDLLKFASVSRRTPVNEGLGSYQRLIDGKRIKNIGENFISKKQGYFPNNVILKLDTNKTKFKSFKNELESHNLDYFKNDIGILEISQDYNSAWVIDGQHRLFSYFKTLKENDINESINIAAIVGVSPSKEVSYFLDINDKSKPVPKDLIWDLNGDIDPSSDDGIISNSCKFMYTYNPKENEGINPFYRTLSIPSYRNKGPRTFSALCGILKRECGTGGITKKTFNKWIEVTDDYKEDITSPYFDKDPKKMSENIGNAIVKFFVKLSYKLDDRIRDKIYKDNDTLFILTILADKYYKYHEKKTPVNDNFFDILAQFLNGLSDDVLMEYKKAYNAELRRGAISDFIYNLNDLYKSDFGKIKPIKLIDDIHNFIEDKFPLYVYKKIKSKYGVNFVMRCPNLQNHASEIIRNRNWSGKKATEDELFRGLNFYSDIWKQFIFNKNSLRFQKDDEISLEIQNSLNENKTLNVWNDCFEDVFTVNKKRKGFRSRDELEQTIQAINRYRAQTTHSKTKERTKRESFDPLVRNKIKAEFDLLNSIINDEMKRL